MEEVSSVESFHTEAGEAATDKPDTSEAKSLKPNEDETTTNKKDEIDSPAAAAAENKEEAAKAVEETEQDKDKEETTNDANNDDEFEQISDGTFEVDENSQATSAGASASGGVANNDENTAEGIQEATAAAAAEGEEDSAKAAATTKDKAATELVENVQENDEISRDDGEAVVNDEDDDDGAGFENVDANMSANSTGATAIESDALGQDDMTLPTEKGNVEGAAAAGDDDDDNAQDASSMEVDESTDAAEAENAENEETSNGNEEADDRQANDDVEMGGGEVSKEVDESMEATKVDNDEENAETKKIAEEIDEAEKLEKTPEETSATAEENEGAADDDETGDVEMLEKDAAAVDADDKHADEVDKVAEPADDADKEAAAAEDGDDADNDVEAIEDADKDGENVDENEKDAEPEDQSVENVQEPEESDVCLIPDDTENEMTEAEKEKAILARQNAEKEADDAEAEAEREKSAEAAVAASAAESSAPTNDGDDEGAAAVGADAVENIGDNAQATVAAGAESAESGANEEPTNAEEASEAPDPDEPLLEEMHSTSAEPGAQPKIIISWIVSTFKTCCQCKSEKHCGFRYKNLENSTADGPAVYDYLCEQSCCDALIAEQPGKFFVRRKKYLVEEVSSSSSTANESGKENEGETHEGDDDNNQDCLQCKDAKPCKYFFKQDEEVFYICDDDCFNLLNAEEPDKFKLKRHSIRVRNIGATISTSSTPAVGAAGGKKTESRVVARTANEAEHARLERNASFVRRCTECSEEIEVGDKNLLWETLDFCNEICLGKYQRTIGANCQTCNGEVPHQALGKYCVRFGFDIRQFCCAVCLNEYKKGLKTCSCCQKDISAGGEGFLAPVGDKETFKDFCSQACMRRYDAMCNPKKKLRNDTCAVCNNEKPVRVEIVLDEKEHTFCSNPCFSAFKFVSNIVADQCGMCCKYFERKGAESFTIYTDRRPKVFCSRICLNVFIINNRRIVSCQWCKVKKYNFDMIYKQHDTQEILMCSLNCLTLYGVSINAFSRTVVKCDNCNATATPQYHLTMSDASMRNFCTYQCVMQFQSQFARAPLTLESEPAQQTAQKQTFNASQQKNAAPFPTGLPKRVKLKASQQQQQQTQKKAASAKQTNATSTLPVISTVASLASGETMIGNVTVRRSRVRAGRKIDSPPPLEPPLSSASNSNLPSSARGRSRRTVDYSRSPSPPTTSAATGKRGSSMSTYSAPQVQVQVQAETKIVTLPPYPPAVRNVQTSCKPQQVTVGFQCEPKTATKETQTGKDYSNKVLIPVPVPIYIPQPLYMWSAPFPIPVPIPLPIPVPVFIPTTRNSAAGIMKEIKKIQDKMPADPFEAELLMMAEMVAEEKNVSDSDSDDEIKPDPSIVQLGFQNNVSQPQEVAANNSYGEDVLQMALKMATGEYDHSPQHQSTVDLESSMTANAIVNQPTSMHDMHMNSAHHMQQAQHLAVDPVRPGRGRKRGSMVSPVAPRNSRSPVKRPRLQEIEPVATPEPVQPLEKPDANLCLKYTFGVNAWKQWVMTKNADLEKSSMRKRLFKTELLQMTADELNYSLCLFVKEVRKPNGTEYAPDTIYYLVLGIQQYLYENGRIDNIFTDPYYERFTDCLDEVARKFSVLYNDSQYIVTRVEEEHLWECKQLGAHSPHVLLSTLMFFNTKHFNLTTVEEHMQLSFSHIMKHWKRSAQNAKTPGARNVLLRFYPPQAGLDANPRKKKVYEQQENEENPLRCPVRLYEFYLSKCPESVKTRNDVFYLQPERSCVPDSPVWYSTQALSQEALQKMLHRVKMVKEINIALLTS